MKTFTVRDLDRKPGSILDICDKEGGVRVRRRDGRIYILRPDFGLLKQPSRERRRQWLNDHDKWLKRTFPKPISIEQTALVDKLIAGE